MENDERFPPYNSTYDVCLAVPRSEANDSMDVDLRFGMLISTWLVLLDTNQDLRRDIESALEFKP